jgi:hypothetical protein
LFRLAWCGSPACEEALGEGTGATIRSSSKGSRLRGLPGRRRRAEHTVLVARAYETLEHLRRASALPPISGDVHPIAQHHRLQPVVVQSAVNIGSPNVLSV